VPSDPPIACSLGAEELPGRLAAMAAVGRTSLLAAERDGVRAVLRFRPAAREGLAAIVASEAECCAFLSMELQGVPDTVVLTVHAPTGAEPLLHEIVSAFGNPRRVAQ
jgi:hypothetical protein